MKKQNSHFRFLSALMLLVIVSLACGSTPVEVIPPTATSTAIPPTATPLPTNTPLPTPKPIPTISELSQATVQVLAMIGDEAEWWGSGTIISSDGLILTNAHVADPQAAGLALLYENVDLIFSSMPDSLVIAMIDNESRPPVQKYIAEVIGSDGALDLALLQIVSDMEGNPIDKENLDLPFVELGDSDQVQLGDGIRIFGFPGIGGETLTLTKGTVSGFESQEEVGDKAFIKTDSEISGGNSGGLAVNEAGEMIGIPTWVDFSDTGSVIGRLRSINLAKPMIEAAGAGRKYQSKYTHEGSGNEKFTLSTWSKDYDKEECPIDPLERYSSGSLGIVSVWSFDNMTDGEDFAVFYYHNHQFIYYSFWKWEDGISDECYAIWLNYGGQAMPDGDYTVEILAGKGYRRIAIADTTVGPVKSGDITIKGQIFDYFTGKELEGASFIVLNPNVDPEDWLANPDNADVYSTAITDTNGNFTLPAPLERLVEYPVVAIADGYNFASGFLRYGMTDANVDTLYISLEPR